METSNRSDPWNRLEFSLRLRQSASWICFALTELRLRGFAPVGFFCSLTGLVSLRPSANPLHSVKTFSFYFCLVFAFSRTSVCFAAAVANYCPLIFGLGILRIISPYVKTLHLSLAFSAFRFASACGKFAVQHDRLFFYIIPNLFQLLSR